jgi:hypothetical protein
VSAPTLAPDTIPAMTTFREVPVEPYLLELATELGFTEVHQIHRDLGLSPLFYARWKGAPVGITQVTGLGGHLGVAFYQGKGFPTPEEIIEGGHFVGTLWDEVLDTGWDDAAALLVIAKAMLDFRAKGREILYRGTAMPDMPVGL